MPPKKGKSKGGKGKDKGPKKMSKKEIKLRKKYGSLKIEDKEGKEVLAVGLRRDELEWAAEKVKEMVTLYRAERIRFQMERDFLFDVTQTYEKKFKCLKIEQEKKLADNNRLNQDADDNYTIKSIEGKHFRYEAQINCTSMDVRDEIRKRRLKELVEKQWQMITVDLEDQEDILARNFKKYREVISKTREKLSDIQRYVDDHANQFKEYSAEMVRRLEDSVKLFDMTRKMEKQLTEERWGEFLWKMAHNFEVQYEGMKKYYDDATNSNLTLILTLQDMINEAVEKRNMYQEQIAYYKDLWTNAAEKMPLLKAEYGKCRMRHNYIVRTKQAIKTTKKEILITSDAVNKNKMEFRNLMHQYTMLTNQRDHIKANCQEIIADALASYRERYDLDKLEQELADEMVKYCNELDRVKVHFPTPANFERVTTPYKGLMDRKDEHIERKRLTCMRIQKQAEDLRNSLEARLLTVGLKKKHKTEIPSHTRMFKAHNLDWGPASLVAKKWYDKPAPLPEKVVCPDPDEESQFQVCPTDSIRGFLAWKKQIGLAKAAEKAERDVLREKEREKEREKAALGGGSNSSVHSHTHFGGVESEALEVEGRESKM